ncbi:hypothetical protein FXO38_08283 [Capsicum annuum]|nr:hypothetical protein FXO38_08283 [Capsicum annuum]
MDIRAIALMFDPYIILENQCVSHFRTFSMASKGVITTRVIIRNSFIIKFFPGVHYIRKLLGSNILGKDLIIGFKIYKKLRNHLLILTEGVTFMGQFRLYSTIPRLFYIGIEN